MANFQFVQEMCVISLCIISLLFATVFVYVFNVNYLRQWKLKRKENLRTCCCVGLKSRTTTWESCLISLKLNHLFRSSDLNKSCRSVLSFRTGLMQSDKRVCMETGLNSYVPVWVRTGLMKSPWGTQIMINCCNYSRCFFLYNLSFFNSFFWFDINKKHTHTHTNN